MNTAELIEQIRIALSKDSVLTEWCQQTFGKTQTVCIDIDEKNPPEPETDYPVVAVTSIRQVRGDSAREISWELEIGVGVIDEEIITNGNCRTMAGFIKAETLRELAEDALYRARIASLDSNSESGSISLYPLFISGSVIPIKTLKSNRRGLPG
ncbi:hypothetical protein [Desulfobacula phenolica]|uniref:Uncharacterized protein n=1 Tax=Desulfobacula phenolica TaxID=90732 RepID=A0A1H2I3E3_9BACT|nr:hypothetical protein [Desulfobacula phenolica]SDU38318.1 hypothetical protein SAMN04487931_107195 [Desulfobacula phenolica]